MVPRVDASDLAASDVVESQHPVSGEMRAVFGELESQEPRNYAGLARNGEIQRENTHAGDPSATLGRYVFSGGKVERSALFSFSSLKYQGKVVVKGLNRSPRLSKKHPQLSKNAPYLSRFGRRLSRMPKRRTR